MTISTTLPPPKEKPWHKCSTEGCNNLFQAYHGKRGCCCHVCDDLTPLHIKAREDLQAMTMEN